MVSYNIDWLKERGFFKRQVTIDIQSRKVFIDDQNLLAYTEVSNREELEEVKRELAFTKASHMWFYFPSEDRLKVFRRFGEVKWFYYSSGIRSDFVKSKVDKLNRFSPDNVAVLFDVRDVVNRFYDQLWEIRLKMARSITQLREDVDRLLIAQHLIDRLIFFYFLCQLGIVRIESESKNWSLNRKNTREFLDWVSRVQDDNDLQIFLNKLFFNVLGKVDESGWSSSQFKIKDESFRLIAPSLNGGLFAEQEKEGFLESKLLVKGTKGLILDVLNNYNWIIGEELPEEEDVIGDLTPEIIGHIYEKFIVSLEKIGIGKINLKDVKATKGELRLGRKKIGAFYTPEEITGYISQNTIYPYIRDRLEERFGHRYEKTWQKLLKENTKIKMDDFDCEVTKYLFFEILEKLKICDHACGSGSFLIAAGEILLDLYNRAWKALEDSGGKDEKIEEILGEIQKSPSRDYHIVKRITTSNLYGLDIAEGAIEIAKLRFWLWLISKVEKATARIEPLPNLDFNLMIGNALIGYIEPQEIEIGAGTFLEPVRQKGQSSLTQKSKQLGFVKGEPVTEIMKEIGRSKRAFKLQYDPYARRKLRDEIDHRSEPLRNKVNAKLLEKLGTEDIDISEVEFLELKPFHWGLEFYETFDLDKQKEERGFDIIIGNPPYIDSEEMVRNQPQSRKVYSKLYPATAKGNWDIFCVFLQKGTQLLKNGGYLGMIVPNKMLSADYATETRRYLQRFRVMAVRDYSKIPVFQASVYPIIVIMKKEVAEKNQLLAELMAPYGEATRIAFSRKVNQQELKETPDSTWAYIFERSSKEMLERIQSNSMTLTDDEVSGAASVSEAYELKSLVRELTTQKDYFMFINTGTIDRYSSLWNTSKTRYIKASYNRPVVLKKNLEEFSQRRFGEAQQRKIIIAGMCKRLECCLDEGHCLAGKSTIIVSTNRVNMKYLLAILNSKLMTFTYRNLFRALSLAGGFVRVGKPQIRKLPIRIATKKQQKPLIELVNKITILSRRLADIKDKKPREIAEIRNEIDRIDSQIDELVYGIYGIKTEAEKKIIEESIQ